MPRLLTTALLTAGLLLGFSTRPAAAGCDLSQVIGYTLYFSKTVEAYIEDGKRVKGFDGCTRDRVLVFTDGTGVRCKEAFFHAATLPVAYVFAKDRNDMKLFIDGDMYAVAQAN